MTTGFAKEDSGAVKGFAILLIYIHHLFYSATSFNTTEVNFLFDVESVIFFASAFCKVGVAIFIFITGMVLHVNIN